MFQAKTDQEKLAKQLKKLEPGFLPYEIFVEIARLVVLPIIEFVPLRLSPEGKVEVLLLHRSPDDPIWSDAVHTPGTVIRATDTEGKMYLAFERIFHDELKDVQASAPYYVGSILHKSLRGTEQAQIFWVEVLEEPKIGKFYPVDDLPPNIIESQLAFIRQAARNYLEHKQTTRR